MNNQYQLENRHWERWDDEDVSRLIHNYWIESAYEMKHREALAKIVKTLYVPGKRFLEAGCGSGLIYKNLVPNVMSNQCYTGIDITENMLAIAQADYPHGQFLKDDLYALSFENKSFDFVAAFEVLGHLPDILIPIREMCRVASRVVLFTVWSSDSSSIKEEKFKDSTFIHATFSHSDVLKMIKAATDDHYLLKTLSLAEHTVYIIYR